MAIDEPATSICACVWIGSETSCTSGDPEEDDCDRAELDVSSDSESVDASAVSVCIISGTAVEVSCTGAEDGCNSVGPGNSLDLNAVVDEPETSLCDKAVDEPPTSICVSLCVRAEVSCA
jgi:hypothetical protein